eukprot:3911281-Rhodomonas_salina.1
MQRMRRCGTTRRLWKHNRKTRREDSKRGRRTPWRSSLQTTSNRRQSSCRREPDSLRTLPASAALMSDARAQA